MPTSLKGSGRGGGDTYIRESIARTQLAAVNKLGAKKAEAKKKTHTTFDYRRALLKEFAPRQLVNNGKEEAVVVEALDNPPVLSVRLKRGGKLVTWAPEHIQKGPVQK